MVRPYLNKSDHEEYLRQYQAERNKRLKKRFLIAGIASVVLVSLYFSIFGGSTPTSETFPSYLGGESENSPSVEEKILDEEPPMVADEETEKLQNLTNPGQRDINQRSTEGQKKDSRKPDVPMEEADNPSNPKELEASNIQAIEDEIAELLHEFEREPIAEKVSNKSGMRKNPELSSASILFSAEKMPKFPGGYSALNKYIRKRLRIPEEAKNQHIKGTVQVQFIVEVNGSIQSPRIAKGLGHGCDEVALALVKSMPRWIPGKHNGEEVAVYYNLPIKFSGD